MARLSIYKYSAVLLLLMGLTCCHAHDTEPLEIDKEMLLSRNRLLDSMFEDAVNLTNYAFERGDEICQKLLDEEAQKNETSEELDYHKMNLKVCAYRVVRRLEPAANRRGDHPEEIPWHKYGFENIRRNMDRKYEEFYVEIVRRIDEYVKALTPEQQSRMTARNLKMWSSKIKDASTLAAKEMAFGKCMRLYYFERGV